MKSKGELAMTRTGKPAASARERDLRVSIVEDDDWLRDHLAEVLDQQPGFRCISRFSNAEAALGGLPADPPDVALMDIGLPGMSGIECVRRLKETCPSVQVVMLTVYGDSERVFAALQAGGSGYLLKRAGEEEILDAVRQVHRGESPMDGQIARMVVRFFNRQGPAAAEMDQLSPREREVIDQLAKGGSYKQIAAALDMSLETLRGHIKSVYRKLHVHSRAEAVAKTGMTGY